MKRCLAILLALGFVTVVSACLIFRSALGQHPLQWLDAASFTLPSATADSLKWTTIVAKVVKGWLRIPPKRFNTTRPPTRPTIRVFESGAEGIRNLILPSGGLTNASGETAWRLSLQEVGELNALIVEAQGSAPYPPRWQMTSMGTFGDSTGAEAVCRDCDALGSNRKLFIELVSLGHDDSVVISSTLRSTSEAIEATSTNAIVQVRTNFSLALNATLEAGGGVLIRTHNPLPSRSGETLILIEEQVIFPSSRQINVPRTGPKQE